MKAMCKLHNYQSMLYRSSKPYATKEMILWLSEDVMFINEEDKVDGEEDALD